MAAGIDGIIREEARRIVMRSGPVFTRASGPRGPIGPQGVNSGLVNLAQEGAVGGDAAQDTAAFTTALAKATALGCGIEIPISEAGAYLLTADFDIPATVGLVFAPGALLSIGAGHTLNHSGPIVASASAFTGAGSVKWTAIAPDVVDARLFGLKGNNDGAAAAANVDALSRAAAAAGIGGVIELPAGIVHLNASVQLLDFQTLRVLGSSFGAGGSPRSQLKWTGIAGVTPGIIAGVNNVFENILFRGPGGLGNDCRAIYSASGHPTFSACKFYSWAYGNDVQNAYYTQYQNRCEFAYCRVAIKATACYNMDHFGTVFRGAFATVGYFSNCIQVVGGIKHLAMFGGSVEGYDSSGAFQVDGDSLVDFFGLYWESSEATSASFGIVMSGTGSTVNLFGNQVYLSNANRWLNAGGLNGITVNSRGNRFVCSAASVTNPIAYVLPTNGTLGTVDVGGDDWSGVALPAASYVGGTLNAGAVLNKRIVPPTGLTAFFADHDFIGRALTLPKRTAAPANPVVGSVYLADHATWNPLARVPAEPYLVFWDGAKYCGMGEQKFIATAAWDPPAIANGGAPAQLVVAVAGAALGDVVAVSFDKSLQGLQLTGYVSAAGSVTVELQNPTGAPVDLVAGTIRVVATRY